MTFYLELREAKPAVATCDIRSSTMKQIETQDHFTATADYVTKSLSEQTTEAK